MAHTGELAKTAEADQGRQAFVDWMKALGMLLIVVWHLLGKHFNEYSFPICPKQLGVAFFIFIMGWSLSNDSRAAERVVFNRLFPVYFYGLLFAILISVISLIVRNDANLSNYMPFFLGVNVLFNYFPANPTTWYIGTYLHILLFWYLWARKQQGSVRLVVAVLFCEILMRALLIATGKSFIGYMIFSDWLAVFCAGMYVSGKKDLQKRASLIPLLMAWIAFTFFWKIAMSGMGFEKSFPFYGLAWDSPLEAVFRSALISTLYLVHTTFCFLVVRGLPPCRLVSFFARNTVVIFIAHMPLIYLVAPVIYRAVDSFFWKKAIMCVIAYVGLALLSELIGRVVKVRKLGSRLYSCTEIMVAKRLGLRTPSK